MLRIARILSFFPFTVNVFGKKRDWIVKTGNLFYSKTALSKVEIDEVQVDFSSDYYRIWAYATLNFQKDFEHSPLGIYMKSHLTSGNRFIDIGANLGGYSRWAKKLGAEVDSFEPVPALSKVLQAHPLFFGNSHPMALSNEKGKMSFYTSSDNIGGSSLVQSNTPEQSGYDGEVEVEVDTFDRIFKESIEQKERFHLVKIDVEGNELKVVEGMKNALTLGLIEALWCEVRGWNSDRNPGTFQSVSENLKSHGYEVFEFREGQLISYDFLNATDVPQFFDLIYLKQ